MREIKFRAWVDDSMWNVNGLAQSDDSDEMDLIDHSIGGYDEVHLFDYTKDCVLMQYIGLKDRNGKEIYEGDIIQYEWNGEVKRDFIEYQGNMFTVSNAIKWNYEKTEVIGNIYETPELLEVKP